MVNKNARRFDELCRDLRRNHPKHQILEIPTTSFCIRHFSRRLSEALQGNHHVSSMNLNLSFFIATNVADKEGKDCDTALLARYIRESRALRKVALVGNLNGRHPEFYAKKLRIVRLILLAIAENPGIKDLHLQFNLEAGVFLKEIALLLRTTQSLKSLKIDLGLLDDRPSSRELVLANAFGANRTLESLELTSDNNADMLGSVLLHLVGSHPRLRELKLDCGTESVAALAYFMRSTTLQLEHLCLRNIIFQKECMEQLVEGLQLNQSLTKLSIVHCNFDLEAIDVFRSFMQKGGTMSCIRELCIEGIYGNCAGILAGTMVASMLTTPDGNRGTGSSIGSLLQVLQLVGDFTELCRTLTMVDTSIALLLPTRHACNSVYNGAGWESLVSCLSKLGHHQEFYIPYVACDYSSCHCNLVDKLKISGSFNGWRWHWPLLGDVAIAYNRVRYFSPEKELRLTQIYCKRNAAKPILVAKVRLDKGHDFDKTDLPLLPVLFQLAKQDPRTAHNAMLIGLLAAGESIGPRCCHYGGKSYPGASA